MVFVGGSLELAQGVQEVCLVQGQGAVEEFVPTGADPTFHDCVHARHTDSGRDDGDAVVARIASKAARILLSRSRIKCLTQVPAS